MKHRNTIIVGIITVVLVIVLWDRLADLGAEIYRAFA